MNRFNRLGDIITFGKYKQDGITVKYLIDNYRSYYDFLAKKGMVISRVVEDYANNNYLTEQKIVAELGKNDIINIKEIILLKRNTSQKTIYSEFKILGQYPIPSHIEYENKTEIRTRSWLGNGVQQDDINCFSEYEVTIRICKNPEELEKFKKDCINIHKK